MKTFKKIDNNFFEIIQEYSLSAQEMAVCLALVGFLSFDSNKAICSLKQLEIQSSTSKKTLLNSLRRLEFLNLISKEVNKKNKNVYTLSFAFFGVTKTEDSHKKTWVKSAPLDGGNKHHTSKNKWGKLTPSNGGNGNHLMGEIDTTLIYSIKNKNKNNIKTSSSSKDVRCFQDDDDFGEKMEMCKQYLSALKQLNLVNIKTSESHYLMSMYKNNEKFNTWDNLKQQINNRKQEIRQKTTKEKLVKNQFYETTDGSGNKIIVDCMGRLVR